MTRRDGERGAALLIALGGLALISALAAAALSLTSGPMTRAAAAVAEAQATRAAEAAIHRLAAAMAREDLRRAVPLDGAPVSTSFMGAKVDFAGQDAAGLIDLNQAPEAVLARLAEATGAGDASMEIASIWAEARRRANGRRPFAALEDALGVLPPRLRPLARPALDHATVWSGLASVDPRVATAPALAAAADLPLDLAQGYVAARTVEGRRAALPDAADLAALIVSDGAAARLEVRATTPRGGRAAIRATVRATGSPAAPIVFLDWR